MAESEGIFAAPEAPSAMVFAPSADENRLELVPVPETGALPPQEIAQPFVVIDDSGVFSRILLARALNENGHLISAVVKIQKDIIAAPPPGFARRYTNADAVAAFLEEAACVDKLQEDGEGIVPPIRSVCRESTPASTCLIQSLPITYCKKTSIFFHTICPECGEFLRVCRDELLLSSLGLPLYTSGTQRLLYCPHCGGQKEGIRTFFALAAEPTLRSRENTRLRFGPQLYRDYQHLVNLPDSAPEAKGHDSAGINQFPCRTCAHRKACYPRRLDDLRPIPAEQLLYPVAYYEFLAIAREYFEMELGQLYRYLGGQSRPQANGRPIVGDNTGPDTQDAEGRYFFGNAPGEKSALEILWLKLSAFEQLCEGVHRVYELCDRPHLDLHPQSVLAQPGQSWRWSFRVGLANPAAAVPAQAGLDRNVAAKPYLPPVDYRRLFTSPLIRRSPFGHEEYANVTLRAVEEQESGVVVRAHLASEVIGAFHLNPRDWLRITLNIPANKADGLCFWVSSGEPVHGGYLVSGRTPRLRPDVKEALAALVEHTVWDCRVNICRIYHAPCDLYSLGMILWCILLVNDQQDESAVCRRVEDLRNELLGVTDPLNQSSSSQFTGTFYSFLAENQEFFGPEAIFFHATDRAAGRHDIPAGLWRACQKLGLDLLANSSVFSPAGGSEKGGSELIKKALDRLKDLNLWAEGRLFGKGAFDRELSAVLGP